MKRVTVAAAAVLMLAASAVALADNTAKIHGTIHGPDGRAVDGASITVRGPAYERKITADRHGHYIAFGVPPGVYTIDVSAIDEAPSLLMRVRIDADQLYTCDFALEPPIRRFSDLESPGLTECPSIQFPS